MSHLFAVLPHDFTIGLSSMQCKRSCKAAYGGAGVNLLSSGTSSALGTAPATACCLAVQPRDLQHVWKLDL